MRVHGRAIRVLTSVTTAVALAAAFLGVSAQAASAVTTSTLTGAQFNPGYIIDDSQFFTGSAMTAAEIQTFLSGHQRGCTNSSCLSILKLTTSTKAADKYCPGSYQGATNETAAAMIYKVQLACGISAKVLLATLEKEQGLVSSTAPTSSQIAHAMGYLCPDTAPCSSGAAGLFSQVYGAARQFQIYRLAPSYFNFRAGMTAAILYNPNAACGTKSVYIRNSATAALYDYTPYTPNAAALANLNGLGDSCSSYGNRNFWVFYNSWFGSATPPFGVVDQASVTNGVATVRGWSIDPTLPLTPNSVTVTTTNPLGATSTMTLAADQSRPDVGKAYPYAAASDGTTLHGFSTTFAATALGQYSFCVTTNIAPGSASGSAPVSLGCTYQWYNPAGPAPTTSRLSGVNRYETAVAVSQATFPTSGVPVVYLASGESYYDSLAAGPAAAVQGGPLLLTQPTSLPSATRTELLRLKPAQVVVVGGPAAVSDAVVSSIGSTLGVSVTRVSGADRFLTAQAIAKSVFPNATSAFAVSGLDYPDALSASAAAGVAKAPILLSNGAADTADAKLGRFLSASPKIASVNVVGGTTVMTPSVAAGIQQTGKKVTRIAGDDRFLTSHAVANAFFPKAQSVFLATGTAFADALTGGVAAAHSSAPLLVVHPNCVPSYDTQSMLSAGTTSAVLLGGTSALASPVAKLAVCH